MSSEDAAPALSHSDGYRASRRSVDDVAPILKELADGLRQTLPSQLVGVYLAGSFALRDADEDSDIDFIVVIRNRLTDAEVARLQRLHARIHDLPGQWARRLEGSYVSAAVLGDLARRHERLWYVDNGARELIRSTHCNTAVVRQTVREHGIAVAGPDPRTLIDPVPIPLLRAEMLATLRTWGAEILAEPARFADRFYQGFIVLHHCRIWCDLETGSVGSKRRGAAWVQERVDPSWHDLIDRAWATRHDPAQSVRTPADPADYARTLDLVRLVTTRFAAVDAFALSSP